MTDEAAVRSIAARAGPIVTRAGPIAADPALTWSIAADPTGSVAAARAVAAAWLGRLACAGAGRGPIAADPARSRTIPPTGL
jgi:hypothetical protein